MKKIDITNINIRKLMAFVTEHGYSGKDFTVESYRPVDETDLPTAVKLKSGEIFVKPPRRLDSITRMFCTWNKSLYQLIKDNIDELS